MSVFIIMNEWTDVENNTHSELIGGKYFTSEDSAHAALAIVAGTYEVELTFDEMSFSVEDYDPHTQFEEYYIQELTRGDSE